MRRVVLFIFLVFSAVIALAQDQNFEWADYTPYCGTWQYVNKDTTFTLSLKVVNLRTYESTGIYTTKLLVGGYRLTVKGKFDDNYLETSKIPSTLKFKYSDELGYEGPVPKNHVYIHAAGYKEYPDIEAWFWNQTKNRKYDGIPGFMMKILPNGKLQWYWSQQMCNLRSWDDPRLPQYIQIPGHAIMTKIK